MPRVLPFQVLDERLMNMKHGDFRNPGAFYRPAPLWSWNDSLDVQEVKRQIDEMAGAGMSATRGLVL